MRQPLDVLTTGDSYRPVPLAPIPGAVPADAAAAPPATPPVAAATVPTELPAAEKKEDGYDY